MTRLPTRAGNVMILLAAAWLLLPAPVFSQGQQCVFQIDNVDRQGAVVETPQGTNYFAGGNVRLSCRGTKISMESDSVAAYGGNVVQFIGRVKYRDSTLTMATLHQHPHNDRATLQQPQLTVLPAWPRSNVERKVTCLMCGPARPLSVSIWFPTK